MIEERLFDGQLVRLAAPDPDRDAVVISGWTHDPIYLRMLAVAPARPKTVEQVKKELADEDSRQNRFLFAIRTQADDRLVGLAWLDGLLLNHGVARLQLGIGRASDRRQGYGHEALELLLRYGFTELNLHRFGVAVPGYNTAALDFFQGHSFEVEARRREALDRAGQRWDLIHLGLLRIEWEADQ